MNGQPRAGGKNVYVPPDPKGMLHQSLAPAWRILEWIPKSMKWNEWPRPQILGYYILNAEPRPISNLAVKPRIHQSVLDRKTLIADYLPVNFPEQFEIAS